MRATRQQIKELAAHVEIEGRAIAALATTAILTDQELHAKARLLAANASTLLVWTEEAL